MPTRRIRRAISGGRSVREPSRTSFYNVISSVRSPGFLFAYSTIAHTQCRETFAEGFEWAGTTVAPETRSFLVLLSRVMGALFGGVYCPARLLTSPVTRRTKCAFCFVWFLIIISGRVSGWNREADWNCELWNRANPKLLE